MGRGSLLLMLAGLAACGPKAPLALAGVQNGQVTTTITVSCPGMAPQTERNLVSVDGCTEGGESGVTYFGFTWQGSPIQCAVDFSDDHAATTMQFSWCSEGWNLTKGSLVPEAFPWLTADESYASGSFESGGQTCSVSVEGPLYDASDAGNPFCCTCLLDGGMVDGGPEDGGT